jgi:serine/threonine protein kinase
MTTTKYILGEVVGSGGMGIVHRAVAEGSTTPVAIKQLRPELVAEPLMVRRFETELRVGQTLAHPNIVRLVDFGDTPLGPPFLVMAWAEGESLASRIARAGAMDESDAVAIVTRLLDALSYAHDRGIVHGDVKSANVLLAGDADAAAVTLIDWGLARFLAEPAARATHFVAGTPGYMAPEVLRGDAPEISSDVYAAGVILYELLTGSAPFGTGTGPEISGRQLRGEIDPPSTRVPGRAITPSLEQAVIRSIARSPADRFASAHELARAIANVTPTFENELFSNRPTLDLGPEVQVRKRLAVGTEPANVTSDADHDAAIAEACLSRASELLAARDLRGSAQQLQRAVDALRLSQDPSAALWPVLLSLAAVHSGLGDRANARRIAAEAKQHAQRASAAVGMQRAEALLGRLQH